MMPASSNFTVWTWEKQRERRLGEECYRAAFKIPNDKARKMVFD